MARIRSIKPEFWDSPGTARASMRARLFFIAMWNWADDWGIGDANAKRLVGFAFPNDDDISAADYPTLRGEMSECFDVQFYTVEGRDYYSIPSWEDHQRTEKKARRANPGPDEADDPVNTTESERPTFNGGSSDAEPRIPARGNRGAWEEGTGEQGNRGSRKPSPAETESLFDDAYEHWPKKVERKAALEKFRVAAKKIGADTLAVHVAMFGDAYAATTERQFVPALGVWLSHERWTDELPAAPEVRREAPRQTAAARNLTTVEHFARLESQTPLEINA